MSDVEPYYVIVTGERANIRCGAGSVWYAVTSVSDGDMLKVDGHEMGWLRVHYPPGTRALVRVDAGRLDEARGMVVLTRRSTLFANNPLGGVSESWRALLSEEMRPGDELQHVETVRDHEGKPAGFRVIAPPGARGFINENFVRPATEEEIRERLGVPEAHVEEVVAPTADEGDTGAAADAADAPDPAPAPAEVAPVPEPRPEPRPETRPETRPADPTPTQPRVREAEGDLIEVRPRQEDTPRIVTPEPVRAAPERAAPERETERAADGVARPATLEQLNAAYQEVMRAPLDEAEFSTLIAEYGRLRGSLPEDEIGARTRSYIDLRVEVLSIRRELQDALRQMDETERSADRGADRVRALASDLDARPRYTVVGRLSASTVYDGERLPLMYRVQSVDGGRVGRTIAYVVPSSEVDLRGRLGMLVGIVGDERVDAALQMPIIRPRRVDALGVEQR
ncbi:MAG: hypothetical protein EA379_04015 [Phycisphaerales bacterium]|nr:MAG: hypothetical protein EA379_04015 [Phycisphaerales bacterium]